MFSYNSNVNTYKLNRNIKSVEYFNCAYVENFLRQGFIFIYSNAIIFKSNYFSTNPYSKILFSEIIEVKKVKYLKVFDNSICIKTENGKSLLFTSFISRDKCFELIKFYYKSYWTQTKIEADNKRNYFILSK